LTSSSEPSGVGTTSPVTGHNQQLAGGTNQFAIGNAHVAPSTFAPLTPILYTAACRHGSNSSGRDQYLFRPKNSLRMVRCNHHHSLSRHEVQQNV